MRTEREDRIARVAHPQSVIVRNRSRDRHGRVRIARVKQREQPLLRTQEARVRPSLCLRNRVVEFPDLWVVVREAAREGSVLGDVGFDLRFPRFGFRFRDGVVNDDGADALDRVGSFLRKAGLNILVRDLRDRLAGRPGASGQSTRMMRSCMDSPWTQFRGSRRSGARDARGQTATTRSGRPSRSTFSARRTVARAGRTRHLRARKRRRQ